MKKNNTLGAIVIGVTAGAIAGGVVKGVTMLSEKVKKRNQRNKFVGVCIKPINLQLFKEVSDKVLKDRIKESVETMDNLYTKECEFIATCDKIFPVVQSLADTLDELMEAVTKSEADSDEVAKIAKRYYDLKEEVLRYYETYKLDEDEDCFVDESIENEWEHDSYDENTTERTSEELTDESDTNGITGDGDKKSEESTGEQSCDAEDQSKKSEGGEA